MHAPKAEEAARRIGADRNDFETEFGPTNVALHAVGIAVELGDAGEALRRAAPSIRPGSRSSGEPGSCSTWLARLRPAPQGDRHGARPGGGRGVDPEQVRSHPMVREMVRDLLRGGAAALEPGPARLAQRVGVLSDPQS